MLTANVVKNHPSWQSNDSCQEHRRFFIQFSILLFLFKKTLWTSREARMKAATKINGAPKTNTKEIKRKGLIKNTKCVKKHPKLIIVNNE